MQKREQVPLTIQEGAKKRINQRIGEQKQCYSKIKEKSRPMDAEEDSERKIAYRK